MKLVVSRFFMTSTTGKLTVQFPERLKAKKETEQTFQSIEKNQELLLAKGFFSGGTHRDFFHLLNRLLPSLKFNSSPLKIGAPWKRKFRTWKAPFLGAKMLVLGSVIVGLGRLVVWIPEIPENERD